MNLLDTNIILRFLVADDPDKFERVKKFFNLIESGKISVDLEITVIFEVIYVLISYYKRKKEEVFDVLNKIIDLKNVRVKRKNIVKKTLSVWSKKNIGLLDSQLVALSETGEANCIYSYDKGFDKFKAVNRIEP